MSIPRGKYTFHSRAGPLAQITNEGLTATRKNPLSDFNNAVLIGAQPLEDGKMFEVRIEEKISSWSGSITIGCTTSRPEAVSLPNSLSGFGQDSWIMHGSALVKHGRQRINDYGRDIESLDIGETVGIARVGRKLKFYVNGSDQGRAEDNLPPVVYPMIDLYGKCTQVCIVSPEPLRGGAEAVFEGTLQFHRRCGKLIKISSNGRTARRQNAGNEYNNGVVVSNRPLKDSELFEVRITDMIDKWTGSIEVGITALQPDTMEMPATMTSIQSKTWVMSGSNIVFGGKTLKENYGISLDSLKVGDRVGVMCTEGREFHVIINGSDMGLAVGNISPSVYGVIDIYGRCTEVELVHDRDISAGLEEPAPPILVSRDRSLCFSHIHGANAVISEDKKKVVRQSPDSEFTEGSVFSNRPLHRNELFEIKIDKLIDQWSGSLQLGVIDIDPTKLDLTELEEVMDASNDNVPVWMLSGQDLQHGGEDEADDDEVSYGLHLDQLPEGSKVGVMVNDSGELHYYLNGLDKGCAFTGIPEGVYAAVDVYGQCAEISMCYDDHASVVESLAAAKPITASTAALTHQFHTKCGRNIKLTHNYTVATRVDSYNCGIVFSSGSLKNGEIFEVRLMSIEKNWSGALLIGLVSSLPSDKLRLPEMATSLDNSWIASSVDSGKMANVKQVNALAKLQEGDTVGVSRHSDAIMHVYINHIDLGPVCSNVSESPYAVVDVYGTSTSVSITSTPTDNVVTGASAAVVFKMDKITYKHGKNVSIDDASVATRRDSYNNGIIVSDAPLCDEMLFQVEVHKVTTQWTGGLMIGVTSMDPSHAVKQPSATKLMTGTLVANGKAFTVNGNEIQDLHNYDLRTVKNGDRVGIVCTSSGILLFYVNGYLKGKLLKEKVPKLRYALVDLYGCCEQVKLLPLEKAPSERELPVKVEPDVTKKIKKLALHAVDNPPISVKEVTLEPKVIPKKSLPSSVPLLANPHSGEDPFLFNENESVPTAEAAEEMPLELSHQCPYRQVCKRFLDTLSLPEPFFEPNPQFNLCYCEDCLKGRKDKKVYERGNPPKKYTLPTGWSRFSLQVPPLAEAKNVFNEWHVAFHGTASKNVRKILETGGLVLPGSLVAGGTEVNPPIGHFTKDKRPKGFDVDQIFVSPSIKYSGCEVYARAIEFKDTIGKKIYKCRVAFQVLIEPGSYSVGKETIGYGHKQIDSEFDNSEIEWSTKKYGTTILYGLLIRANLVGPLGDCLYRKICQRFLKTLSLPEPFFEPNPDYNSCFCVDCFGGRKDLVCMRGSPPKKYVRPVGWTRFSLRVPPHATAQNTFQEWHVAFHGTAPQKVRNILDTGGLVVHGTAAGNAGVNQIIVSPSIKYTECEKFTKCKDFKDSVTKKSYKCRVAFQVLIRPDSYKVGAETVGHGHKQVDSEFRNAEIEWSTKQIGATILYGLVIKAEEQRT